MVLAPDCGGEFVSGEGSEDLEFFIVDIMDSEVCDLPADIVCAIAGLEEEDGGFIIVLMRARLAYTSLTYASLFFVFVCIEFGADFSLTGDDEACALRESEGLEGAGFEGVVDLVCKIDWGVCVDVGLCFVFLCEGAG